MRKETIGRVLGLDVGSKTIGVAVTDELGVAAHAVKTLKRKGTRGDVAQVEALARTYDTKRLVVGLPYDLEGNEGPRAARVRVPPGETELAVPRARAYLACGEAQAHALGRSLPMQATAQAQIVLVDEPAGLLGDAAAKRRLWIALRTLRRNLAAAGR